MKLVIFSHPKFLNSQSMPRFAMMICKGMKERGYEVEIWEPKPYLWKIPVPHFFKKWLGYLDQFIIFPVLVKCRLLFQAKPTLYVIADQALGPWVPLVSSKPHVIHVHDFMALRSARGEFPQNPTSKTGRIYQEWIRHGFSLGENFICVSQKTKLDLIKILQEPSKKIDVVYNGLNFPFRRLSQVDINLILANRLPINQNLGVIVHVGGNQWYKNRYGALRIYAEYVKQVVDPLPLWMIGQPPNEQLLAEVRKISSPGCVEFFTDMSNQQVMAAYSMARLLIFPSFAEGFGWPIAEAMSCGCPVLTTGEAPMSEVGGEGGFYVPAMPVSEGVAEWAENAARIVAQVVNIEGSARLNLQRCCVAHAEQFDTKTALDAYQEIYERIISNSSL